MSIYDAVERTLEVVKANFDADMVALVAAKVTANRLSQEQADAMDQNATVYERLAAEEFAAHPDEEGPDQEKLPGIGVYPGGMTTQAKWQGRRDARAVVVLDYYAMGSDPVVLGKQTEFAAEALLRSIDRIPEAAPAGELGAAELKDEIAVLIIGSSRERGMDYYQDRATLTFPILEQDSGL